jgi:hypothetical protein
MKGIERKGNEKERKEWKERKNTMNISMNILKHGEDTN